MSIPRVVLSRICAAHTPFAFTSSDVHAALVRWMYRIGIGNDSYDDK